MGFNSAFKGLKSLLITSHLQLDLPRGFFPSISPTILLLYVPPNSLFLLWSPAQYLVRTADHEAAHYAIFSIAFFLFNNQPDALIIQTYSVMKLYIFRASSLPIIRSSLLYIRHWYVSCRFLTTTSMQSQDEHPDSAWKRSPKTCLKLTSAECTVENSWWWAKKMPETCRVL